MADEKKPKKQKEPGQYVGMGIALGVGIGSALGVALDNIALGIGMGIAIGVAMGAGWEESAKKRGDIRELTKEECARRNKFGWIALLTALALFVILAVAIYVKIN